ncbi:hypothetical protein [Szabonella alba]|uniref:Uncharacterized protein n=1 Tax=Szabonella alba TaxID=2804194 RepID=A0A8K0V9H6_9RHOB|nr:hypothetical protein [Szabonella alba]MBL4917591.1 hypothetical protein [Szabonella alba]
MATTTLTTPLWAMETASFDARFTPASAIPPLFQQLVERLADLLRAERALVDEWTYFPAVNIDPDEITHAFAATDAAAQMVLSTPPASPGDRALQIGALLVRLAIGMEDAVDRAGVHQMIGEARARLLLEPGHPEAGPVNRLLSIAFARLDSLATLEAEVAELPDEAETAGDALAAYL